MKDKYARLSLTTLLLSVSSGALDGYLPGYNPAGHHRRRDAGTPELYNGHPNTFFVSFHLEETDRLCGSRQRIIP